MTVKFVRAPNNLVLIAAGIALLLLAFRAGMVATNHLPTPLVVGSFTRDAVLGAALLFVALRRSQFAGATAVIVATLLTFVVVAPMAFESVAFGSVHVTWSMAIYLAIAAGVIAPSLFPWSGTANKPVLFWMGLTFAAVTLLLGTIALTARL
jgi:hypothetical protein